MTDCILLRGDGAKNGYGNQVEELQGLLWDIGAVGPDNPFWTSSVAVRNKITSPDDPKAKAFWIDKDFGIWVQEAVAHSQMRLTAQRGIPLEEVAKIGVVDLDTWAALRNPNLKQVVKLVSQNKPAAIGAEIVDVWDYYIKQGIREIPNGSNRGPTVKASSFDRNGIVMWGGINAWISWSNQQAGVGPAWCCLSRCGIEHEVKARHGIDGWINSHGKMALCYANYQWAAKQTEIPAAYSEYYAKTASPGWVITLDDVLSGRVELPVGAACIMNYGGTRGHTFTVAGVIKDANGRVIKIQTREGNSDNKCEARERDLRNTSTIKWFVVSPQLLADADFQGHIETDLSVGDGATR